MGHYYVIIMPLCLYYTLCSTTIPGLEHNSDLCPVPDPLLHPHVDVSRTSRTVLYLAHQKTQMVGKLSPQYQSAEQPSALEELMDSAQYVSHMRGSVEPNDLTI